MHLTELYRTEHTHGSKLNFGKYKVDCINVSILAVISYYSFAKCYHCGKVGILVSQSCDNKIPPTGWLQTTYVCFFTIPEVRNLKSSVSRVMFFPRILKEETSLSLPASGSHSHSLGCDCINPISASIFMWLSSLRVSLSLCLFSSSRGTSHIRLGPTLMILNWLNLQRLLFPNKVLFAGTGN